MSFMVNAFVHSSNLPAMVFVLAGADNASGWGPIADLPEYLDDVLPNVQVYFKPTADDVDNATWQSLEAGANNWSPEDEAAYPANLSFGLEMQFGYRMAAMLGRSVYIIKYARAGAKLNNNGDPNWSSADADGLFNRLTNIYIDRALRDMPEDYVVGGVILSLGESDCEDAADYGSYGANLSDWIDDIRAELAVPDLPVVICRTYPQDSNPARSSGGPVVRAAQLTVAVADANVHILTTDDFAVLDTDLHIDAAGQIELGNRVYELLGRGIVAHPPTVASPVADTEVISGAAFLYTIPANTFFDEDLENGVLVYSAALSNGDALPAWLSFNPATRVFSGTPDDSDVEELEVRVTVTDVTLNSASTVFGLSVIANVPQVGNAVVYSGTGAVQSVTGAEMEPDLVLVKSRGVGGWRWTDSVRGPIRAIESNTTAAEVFEADGVTAFDADGFTVGANANYNTNATNYLALCFKEMAGAMDIVQYTGNAVQGRTVPHNLEAVPELMILSNLTSGGSRMVYPGALTSPETKSVMLHSTNAANNTSVAWDNTLPTDEVFSVGLAASVNANGSEYIAYLFASKEQATKVGTYVGDGANPAAFVEVGFRPRFVIVKNTTVAGDWIVFDTARDTVAPHSKHSSLNTTAAESTEIGGITFSDTGFQFNNAGAVNVSGSTYLYLAVR